MKKINYPLLIGAIIIVILMIFSFYPEYFSNADPYGSERTQYNIENGKSSLVLLPILPNEDYPWGTDMNGRDIKGTIIYGTKLTIMTAVLIALGRLCISLPVAIMAAYRIKAAEWFIKEFNIIFSAFPLILVIIILGNLQLLADIFKEPKYVVSFMLIAFGWSKLALSLKNKTADILDQDFIEGEISIGKNKLEIAVQNIIPHLIPSIIIFFFMEIAMVLLVLAQLGVLGMVFGGGYSDADGNLQIPTAVEWNSLLAFAGYLLGTANMWIIFYPAAAFAISIVGFNFFGEGLRLEFEKRNSKIITFIRRIPAFLSPLRLIYEIKNIEIYRKKVYQKIAFYLVVLLIIFFPHFKTPYHFDSASAFSTVTELSDSKYEGRRAGSGNNAPIAQYLSDKLKSYGVQPFDGTFLYKVDIPNSFNIKDSTMYLQTSNGEKIDFTFRKDYLVTSLLPVNQSFKLVKIDMKDFGKNVDLRSLSRKYNGKMIVADLRGLFGNQIEVIISRIMSYSKPSGIIYIGDWVSGDKNNKSLNQSKVNINGPVLETSSEVGDEILRHISGELAITVNSEVYNNQTGYNVIGCIPGTDEKLKNDYIIIGSSIDSVGSDDNQPFPASMEAAGSALALEIARNMTEHNIKPKRTIIFAFWDGTYTDNRGSLSFTTKYIDTVQKNAFYIDLRSFGNNNGNKVMIDSSRIRPNLQIGQDFIRYLKESAKRNGVELSYGKIFTPVIDDFSKWTKDSIVIDSDNVEKILMTPEDNPDNINKKEFGKVGQMVIDTMLKFIVGGGI